jgi:SAM-dependent methyltransferase
MRVVSPELETVHACNLCGSSELSLGFTRDGWQYCICAQCGLGRTDPRRTLQSLPQFYDEDYWQGSYTGRQYTSKEIRHFLRRYGRRVTYLRRFKRKGRLLEVGTGFGFFLESARRRGCDVHGPEFSSWAAKKAESRFGLPISNASVADFHPENGPYDLIVAWHVLEHLPDPMANLCRIRTWLKADGILAVEVPNFGSADAERMGDKWEGRTAPHHLWHCTPQSLQAMLENPDSG